MRIVKLALISVVVLFGIMLLISLLLPSHVRVSRAIDITASPQKIRPLLEDIRQWDKWNAYVQSFHNRVTEPDMLKSDEIAVFVDQQKKNVITADWQQPSGNRFQSGYAIFNNNGKSFTTVQWYFDFHVKWYPWEKFQSIIYDQELGPVMEKSLAKLRQMAESLP